jgi:hypothetical protein
MDAFLSKFRFGEGLLAICIGSPAAERFYNDQLPEIPADRDVYFAPALRKEPGNEKSNVLGTKAVWVDADDPQKPLCTLPPSIMVSSGHGWHVYWLLNKPLVETDTIEQLNHVLIRDVPTSDPSCWNVNRLLRVPGTLNTKEPKASVVLKLLRDVSYEVEDFLVLDRLDAKTKHKIRTGDSRGYRSRSERDWAIILALVAAGATDKLINLIFDLQPCGDKVKEDQNPNYLEHTIARARSKAPAELAHGFEVCDDGYYAQTRKGRRRVSTFVINPKLLLDGSAFESEDAIVGDVSASGFEWKGQTFTRAAFTSVQRLDREAPKVAWQWLGRDEDVRALLPFLLEQLQENGLPRVSASPTLGLHMLKGKPYFLGDTQVVSSTQCWNGYEGPLAWLPSHKEHPTLDLQPACTSKDLEVLAQHLPLLNEPAATWVMLGWYAASMLKTWFESRGYRFPILNVVGTKGSGKTTLIQRVFMPLFGQTSPKSYDAGTTKFVTLALMGSSNGVPIAFSEFRYDSVEKFLRYVLLAYDTGHDPRGRGDQTTVDYPLSAPFSIDGEDLIEDPAARERILVVHLHPATIEEGSEAYQSFAHLRANLPRQFGGYYAQKVLRTIESTELDEMLNRAREKVFEAFPNRLPDRVRNNHIVAYTGICLWCSVVGIQPPEADVLSRSITSVFDLATGRTRTLSDAMIEDIANACSQGSGAYRWSYDSQMNVLFFQLASGHSWWLSSRKRQGRGALERDAIRAQLKEAPYMLEPRMVDSTWMYGIDLKSAQGYGLDIPNIMQSREFKIRF